MKRIFVSILKNAVYLLLYVAAVIFIFAVSSFMWLFSGLASDFIIYPIFPVIHVLLAIITVGIMIAIRGIQQCSFKKSCVRAVVVVLVYAFLTVGTFFIFRGYFLSFTPEKWQRFPNKRSYMLEDLNRDYNLRERSKDEILDLLGMPNNTYDGTDADYIIDYYVGSFNIDPTMLSFEFENDMVKDMYTYTEYRTNRMELN